MELLIAGAYVTCVSLSVLILVLFVALFIGGLLLRSLFGLEIEPFLPLAIFVQHLGGNGLYVALAALIVVTLVLWFGSNAVDQALEHTHLAVVTSVLVAVVGVTGFVDARYGISPLSNWLPAPPAENHDQPAQAMTLTEIVYFTGFMPRVSTEGILAYEAEMGRFTLQDPSGQLPAVKLTFYERRKLFSTSFDEMQSLRSTRAMGAAPDPRVEAFLGKRVQVTGSASNAAIRAHLTELQLAVTARVPQPVTPPQSQDLHAIEVSPTAPHQDLGVQRSQPRSH